MNEFASGNRLLMVEGDSDRQVVLTLLRNINFDFLADNVKVEATNGVDNLVGMIRSRLISSPFDAHSSDAAVGIIVDADQNVALIWDRILESLRRSDVDVPSLSAPGPNGSIFERGMPRLKVGVWVMPDNESPGELEDFLARMVPLGNPDWPRAQRYVNCSEGDFGRKVTRAKVLAWIATRTTPGRFDEAIANGDLRTDGELCQRFIAWIDRLFNEEEDSENHA